MADNCKVGSVNDPTANAIPASSTNPVAAYVPPTLNVGTYSLVDECSNLDSKYQESVAAENLQVSGTPVNVFKLLGVHEQGKLIDLTGEGIPLGRGDVGFAFDAASSEWVSVETGIDVVTTPSYIGYDFGVHKTSFGQQVMVPEPAIRQHITSIRIQQGQDAETRALQIRVDRSHGGFKVDPLKVNFTGVGNGGISDFVGGVDAAPGTLMLAALSPLMFSVAFVSAAGTMLLGVASVGVRFNSTTCSFTIVQGTTPFDTNDFFTAPVELLWERVDVVNLPNIGTSALIRLRQSSPARYWRIVPLSFAGIAANKSWVIEKLELFDYQATRLDDIQDTLYLENRDRDYAKSSIQLKAAYQPFDAVGDLSKFGFQIADIYNFTTSFATMVAALGRPLVVGDVLELPAEMMYDHNLKPVRKFLEITDTSWSPEGYTTNWRPIIYRFQAQDLIPSQETRDILGTADSQKYLIDDGSFFEGIEQISTSDLTAAEQNEVDAIEAAPRKGTSTREQMSGANRFGNPGTYDGVGVYVEDGLPKDGQPYTTGFKLPDVGTASDGAYFRLEYDPKLNIQARLYKFSGTKGRWIYVETDKRSARTSHRPSQLEVLNTTETMPLSTRKVSK